MGARLVCIRTMTRKIERDGELVEVDRPVYVLAVTAGYRMFATGRIVGPTVHDLANVEELYDNHRLVTFEEDSIITVEGLRPDRRNPDFLNFKTCTNIRYAMPQDTPWEEFRHTYRDEDDQPIPVYHNRVCKLPYWRKILAACLEAGRRPKVAPGGLRYAVAYCADIYGDYGQTIIPAPPRGWEEGDSKYPTLYDLPAFFVVEASEIDDLLEEFDRRHQGSSRPVGSHQTLRPQFVRR